MEAWLRSSERRQDCNCLPSVCSVVTLAWRPVKKQGAFFPMPVQCALQFFMVLVVPQVLARTAAMGANRVWKSGFLHCSVEIIIAAPVNGILTVPLFLLEVNQENVAQHSPLRK
jgi:hypothetical protein